jgi:ABC-2 type transport system ATP-binding protein
VSPSKSIAAEMKHLTKRFGRVVAVSDVSLDVRTGEILGVVGPNGAGKSTVLHMLLGLITPDCGTIRIFGRSLEHDRQAILSRMNIASPYAALPPRLTVQENLSIYAMMYGIDRPRRKIAALLETMDIESLRHSAISRLSSGQIVRVNLCKALLNDPELLLLDEPTAYLDTEIADRIRQIVIGRRNSGAAVVYTSHNMAEIETMCDRVVLLRAGQVAAIGTPIEVTNSVLGGQRQVASLAEAMLRVGWVSR